MSFSRLTVIGRDVSKQKGVYWICECECGNRTSVITNDLKSGHTKSCGCYQKYRASTTNKKYNTYIEKDEHYECYMSNNNYFVIDKEDKKLIEQYCWREDSNGYIFTTLNGKNIYLHKIILNMPSNMLVDHKNHKVNDYRKANLRIASQSENQMNAKLRLNNTSGVTGVYWSKQRQKWIAQLKVNGKNMNLGGFSDFEKACETRKMAEEKYFGEYSYSNSMNNIEEN